MKSDKNALSQELDGKVEGKVFLWLISPKQEHLFFDGGQESDSAET